MLRTRKMPWLSHEGLHEQSSMQMVWLNPARSSQSKFQETIVPRVSRVPHVPSRHLQSAKHNAPRTAICKARSSVKWGCALRVVKRRPLFCDSVVKDQIGSFLCHFPSAQAHFSKRAELVMGERCCGGRPEGGTAFRRVRPPIALAIASRPYTGR